MKLTQNTLQRFQNASLSVLEGYYLHLLTTEEIVWSDVLKDLNVKNLTRLNLIDESSKRITESGRILILNCLDEETNPGYSPEFEKFWKTFPGSDAFLHWPETRKLRTSKKDTYKAYLHALKDTSSENLLSALLMDIDSRKRSVGRDNPFKFMKGSFRWLEDQMFLEVEAPEPVKYADDIIM